MSEKENPKVPDSPGIRQAREFEGFLKRLTQTFHAFTEDESVIPPMACWIMLDNPRRHRDNLGFHRRQKLLDLLRERVGQHLLETDFSAVAGESAIALVFDSQDGDRDFRQLADKLLKDIGGDLFELDKQMVALSISIGLNPFNTRVPVPEECLLQAARLAEAVAANGGGRARIFDPKKSGLTISQDNRSVLSLLMRSLKANTVRVVFQPLVAVSGKESDYYQILPRLQADDGTLIPASRFVPLAQQHNILPALDRWMVSWALKFIVAKAEKGRDVVLFINQSPALLEDPSLMQWLEGKLEASPDAAKGLVLEFRLDYLLAHIKESRKTLNRLINLGVGVSVTGVDETSSAEVLLEHLPSNYLRMGPGFAHRMQDNEDMAQRYEKFADRAQASGRKLIIPMLEDADAVARIWRAKVDLVQGNFIQRPREDMEG